MSKIARRRGGSTGGFLIGKGISVRHPKKCGGLLQGRVFKHDCAAGSVVVAYTDDSIEHLKLSKKKHRWQSDTNDSFLGQAMVLWTSAKKRCISEEFARTVVVLDGEQESSEKSYLYRVIFVADERIAVVDLSKMHFLVIDKLKISGKIDSGTENPFANRPTNELIGKRIKLYVNSEIIECQVVFYDISNKKHRVMDVEDGMLLEFNLQHMRYKTLHPSEYEKNIPLSRGPGCELVGQWISVLFGWGKSQRYYPARVISYVAAKNEHRTLYLEEDSFEDVYLQYKPYKELTVEESKLIPDQELVGCRVSIKVDGKGSLQEGRVVWRYSNEEADPFNICYDGIDFVSHEFKLDERRHRLEQEDESKIEGREVVIHDSCSDGSRAYLAMVVRKVGSSRVSDASGEHLLTREEKESNKFLIAYFTLNFGIFKMQVGTFDSEKDEYRVLVRKGHGRLVQSQNQGRSQSQLESRQEPGILGREIEIEGQPGGTSLRAVVIHELLDKNLLLYRKENEISSEYLDLRTTNRHWWLVNSSRSEDVLVGCRLFIEMESVERSNKKQIVFVLAKFQNSTVRCEKCAFGAPCPVHYKVIFVEDCTVSYVNLSVVKYERLSCA